MASVKRSPLLIGLLAVVVLLGLWIFTSYNKLVTGNEQLANSWNQVETQYQRRFDLIPNLQRTVQGAADFEQETFTAVTAARSQWQSAPTRDDKVAAANNFDSALSRLLVTVEAYPQLRATEAFRDFMAELSGTENRIAVARRDYNLAVRSYNVLVTRFPKNILAGVFGFDPENLFAATEGADQAHEVNFE